MRSSLTRLVLCQQHATRALLRGSNFNGSQDLVCGASEATSCAECVFLRSSCFTSVHLGRQIGADIADDSVCRAFMANMLHDCSRHNVSGRCHKDVFSDWFKLPFMNDTERGMQTFEGPLAGGF